MKTIGLIGGMSWESTLQYYRALNEGVKRRLGGLHSAQLVLYSVDFAAIERLQRGGDWERAGEILSAAARAVAAAGADFVVLCTNTMHRCATAIERAVAIPLLHIVDATAAALRDAGVQTIGLLGTRFTMEQGFWSERLAQGGMRVLVPAAGDRERVHRIIYDELCLGRIEDESRDLYRRIIADLAGAGAQAIVLGCTEIGLLIGAADAPVPVFDTTAIHADAAVEFALAGPAVALDPARRC